MDGEVVFRQNHALAGFSVMSSLPETCQTSHFSWVISAPTGFRAWGLGFGV